LAGCANQSRPRDTAPSAALEDLGDSTTDRGKAPASGRLDLAEATRRAADDTAALMAPLSRQQGSSSTVQATGSQRPWQNRGSEQESSAREIEQPAEQPTPKLPPPKAGVVADEAPAPDPIALVLERLEADEQDPERALAAAFLAQAIRDYASTDDGS